MYIRYPDGRIHILITSDEIKGFACDTKYVDIFKKEFGEVYETFSWTPEDCKAFVMKLYNIKDPIEESTTLIKHLTLLIDEHHVIPKLDFTNIVWDNIKPDILIEFDSDIIIENGLYNTNFSSPDFSNFYRSQLIRFLNSCNNTILKNPKFRKYNNDEKSKVHEAIISAYKNKKIIINKSIIDNFSSANSLYNKFTDWDEVSVETFIKRIDTDIFSGEELVKFYRKFNKERVDRIYDEISNKINILTKHEEAARVASEPIPKTSRTKKK